MKKQGYMEQREEIAKQIHDAVKKMPDAQMNMVLKLCQTLAGKKRGADPQSR